jgi:hypothetical protein
MYTNMVQLPALGRDCNIGMLFIKFPSTAVNVCCDTESPASWHTAIYSGLCFTMLTIHFFNEPFCSLEIYSSFHLVCRKCYPCQVYPILMTFLSCHNWQQK